MQSRSVSAVGSKMEDVKSVVTFFGLSGGTALSSFFVDTLPVVQWCAGVTAILSGLVGILWVVVQFRRSRRQ